MAAAPCCHRHSKTDLGIAGIQDPNSQRRAVTQSWPFTNSGYKVLAYANNRWFLIQQQWQPGTPTIILPDSDSVRVEVAGT